jgi:hypothetical protein
VKQPVRKKRSMTNAMSIRLMPEDVARLEEVAKQLPLPKTTVARLALLLGLKIATADPSKLLSRRGKRTE